MEVTRRVSANVAALDKELGTHASMNQLGHARRLPDATLREASRARSGSDTLPIRS